MAIMVVVTAVAYHCSPWWSCPVGIFIVPLEIIDFRPIHILQYIINSWDLIKLLDGNLSTKSSCWKFE